jgi:glycosyltransferase involved in cell wall biosynthesis
MKLSVAIPAFNAATTIENTVNKICDPTLNFIDEVIIYNDGSNDNTLSVLKKLKSKFLKVKYFSSFKNKGGGYARNFAIKKSKNKLIMVLDADDCIHVNSLKKLYTHALKNNFTAHYSVAKYFSKNTRTIDSTLNFYKFYGKKFTYNKLIKNFIVPNNFIFTKNDWIKAGKYSIKTHWDTQDFSTKFLKNVGSIDIAKGTFYYHRRFVKNYKSYYERQELYGENFFNSYKLFEIIVEDLNINNLVFLTRENIFLKVNVMQSLEYYGSELYPEFSFKQSSLQLLTKIIIYNKNKEYKLVNSLLRKYLNDENLYITDLILFLIIRCDSNFSKKEYNEFRKIKNFFHFIEILKSYPYPEKLIMFYFKFIFLFNIKIIKRFIIK